MRLRVANLLPALLLITASSVRANVDYVKQVKPIFQMHCVSCHGALKQKGELRLDASPLVLKGGKDGAIVVAGSGEKSRLIDALTGAHDVTRMPKDADPLKPAEIALIKQWIDEGAKAPDEAIPDGPQSHWAFKPPVRPAVPVVKNADWVRNPIDAFIAADHEKRGLTPRPQASKETLLRRVTLDLTGLPPTREESSAFLSDYSSDAYEKVVDRLLASPRYGERWGRHWMDVWRYSDWDGYGPEVRHSQPHIWKWRDWIIESLNEDKSYDRMVREMLAGDEIAPADPKTLRATGFLVRNWFKFNRNVWMEGVVEHTGKAFLGMTLNCAKCHDHMFDPVSQREYYAFRAIFEPYNIRMDNVATTLDTKVDGLPRVSDTDENAKTFLFIRGDERRPKTDESIPPTVPAIFGGKFEPQKVNLPPPAYYPGLDPNVRKLMLAAADNSITVAQAEVGKTQAALAVAQTAYTALAQAPAQNEPKPVAGVAGAAVTPKPFLEEDFDSLKADVWKLGPGKWTYKDGALSQSDPALEFKSIGSLADHPPDFTARVEFKITGGTTYHSVGLSFDANDSGDEQAVYLSAHAPDPGVSVFYLKSNTPVYKDQGRLSTPVKLNEPYELRVDVRDRLVNVYVNAKLVLAHKLLKARQPGHFKLWTYDATATFTNARVEMLKPDAQLADRIEGGTPVIVPLDPKARLLAAATALRLANETLDIAKLKVNVASAEKASLAARITADDAKYAPVARADTKDLALAAGRAQRFVELCKAEVSAQIAQNALTAAQLATKKSDSKAVKVLSDAGLKLIGEKAALEGARVNLDKPSDKYAPVTQLYPATSTGRRLALANWITSRENPTAARVAVNHVWMRHFGTPIVSTVFDFGLNGKRPTNQPLLDWLAVQFEDDGWSMKKLHRMMVTSATYRMRSDTDATSADDKKLDPDNVYYWRANSHRMEAEVVRDSLLFVGGTLDLATSGPDIDFEQGLKVARRSVYFRHAHEKQMTFLQLFDAASPNECYRREQSVMPQQALAMANSPLALAQSRRIATQLTRETGGSGDSLKSFITTAFEQVLNRAPATKEIETCETFLSDQEQRLRNASSLTAFASGDVAGVPASWDPAQRARENLILVLINHNDFVTIR
jgi:mono/diheme cytochrome c family protein